MIQNCTEADPPCPTICVERFGFEMDKKFHETILQVLLSPIMLIVNDNVDRSESGDRHLNEGYLMLSGLQVLPFYILMFCSILIVLSSFISKSNNQKKDSALRVF